MSRPNLADHIPGRLSHGWEQPLALDARAVAAAIGVSRAHWLRLVSSGRAPLGVKLGTSRRWARSELELWLEAGCPSFARWEEMRHGGKP